MRQCFKGLAYQTEKSSFFVLRLFIILLSCTYCEENSGFKLDNKGTRNLSSMIHGLGKVQILINNGAQYTKEKEVILTLIPSKDADEMFISFDSDCSTGSWEPLQLHKSTNLRGLNQESFVYVKYRFLGEEETSCIGDSIIHDDIPPVVEFTDAPNPWVSENNISIGVHATDSGSGVQSIQCHRGDGQFESCGQSVVYNSLVENQDHLLVVKVQDKAGNFSEPKQVNWRSDQSSPSLTLSLGPSALTADTTPDFSFLAIDNGSGISHLECRRDNESQFSPCQPEFELSNLSDGVHSIEVKAVDKVGRVSDSVTHTWTQDTTAPTVHFTSKPPALSNSQRATFTFSGVNEQQGIVSYHCQLDNETRETCLNPKITGDLSDGEHVFSVVGRDALGHESSPVIYRWIVDTAKPTLVLVDKPVEKTRSQEARFVLQASDSGSGVQEIQCRIDNETYQSCRPGFFERSNLSEGSHRFLAKSIDRAGNESTEVTHEWLIDRTKPTVTITSGPENPTNQTKASFSFQSQDSGSGVQRAECRFSGGAFSVCESPKEYPEVFVEADHIFSIRVFDEAGNVSEIQTHSWTVDITGPSIELTQKPENVTKLQTAQFAFSGVNNEPVSSYECELDGNTQVCQGGTASLTGLSDGSHNFKVIGLDALGNKSEPLMYTWLVDTTKPTLSFVEKPASLSNSNQGRFLFNAQDGGSGFKEIHCKVDNMSYQVCPNPMDTTNLTDGSHTLMAYSVDNAGNESEVQSYSWSVDTQASNIRFTSKPHATTKLQRAVFAFSETGNQNDIQSYECQLDGGTVESCTSSRNLTGLSDGEHTFSVTGLDRVGNRSAAISYTWRVDTTKPTLSFALKPDAFINTNEAQLSFNAQDVGGSGIKEIRCKVDSSSYRVCPDPMNLTGLTEGSHTVLAKSVDNAGNESDEISHTWTVDQSLPTVSITSFPSSPTRESTGEFSFMARDNGTVSKIECRLDGGSFEVCQDSKTYVDLSDGEHTFSVRAEDVAGNLSQEKSYTWIVDLTAPTIQFSSTPASTVFIGQTAEIQFNASDSGSGIQDVRCSFNGAHRSCSNNVSVFLSATETRENSFQITVSDRVGNQSTETLNWQTKIETISMQLEKEVLEKVPIDILFVIDTSSSMNNERTNLATKIDGFINQIDNMDWQIAATSANVDDNFEYARGGLTNFNTYFIHSVSMNIDLDGQSSTLSRTEGSFVGEGVKVGDTIKLSGYTDRDNNVKIEVTGVSALEVTFSAPSGMSDESGSSRTGYRNYRAMRILDSNMDLSVSQDLFGARIDGNTGFPVGGDFEEAGIQAAYMAIQKCVAGEDPHTRFFRDGAHLAIVVLSDEQAQGAYSPQKFLQFVNSSFPNKTIAWHSIVNNSGTRYKKLSNLTNGIVGNVSASNYTNQLTNMGRAVKNLQKEVALGCAPLDDDLDGNIDMEVKYRESDQDSFQTYSGTYTIQVEKQRLVFDQIPPAGEYQFHFNCAK